MSQHQIASILLNHIRDGWARFTDRIIGDDALDRLDPAELQQLALDTGLTPDQLADAVRADQHVRELLGAMLQTRGLHAGQLAAEQPTTLRALQAACSDCRTTSQCRHELKEGTAAANAEHFCPNAGTMGALAALLA